MSKVSLTFTDDDEGGINVRVEFDPPAQKDEESTPAQIVAMYCVEFMNARAAGPDALDDFIEEVIAHGTWDGDSLD